MPPTDPAWAHFDRTKFDYVRSELDAWVEAILPYLEATKDGPLPDQRATGHQPDNGARAHTAVDRSITILVHLFRVESEVTDSFWPFFDRSQVPVLTRGATPEELLFSVEIDIFRSHYHMLRRIVLAITDPSRQNAWGYAPADFWGQIVPPRNRQRYQEAFGEIYEFSLWLLPNFSSYPTSLRISNDRQMLEASARLIAMDPLVADVLCDPSWTEAVRAVQGRQLLFGRLLDEGLEKWAQLGLFQSQREVMVWKKNGCKHMLWFNCTETIWWK